MIRRIALTLAAIGPVAMGAAGYQPPQAIAAAGVPHDAASYCAALRTGVDAAGGGATGTTSGRSASGGGAGATGGGVGAGWGTGAGFEDCSSCASGCGGGTSAFTSSEPTTIAT